MGNESSGRPSVIYKWLINRITRTLETELQDAVVGDVAELKMSDRRAVCELLGLVLRRQALAWKTWQPWLALVGIVGPVGVLLSRISAGAVTNFSIQALVYWKYGVPYSNGLTEAREIETLVYVSLAVICWSWVGGFVLGTLSGDALYVNGTVFCLVWFYLCGPLGMLVYSARLLLNALHLMPHRALPHNLSEFIFFAVLPLMLETLLFLVPALAGIRQARLGRRLGVRRTILLASAVATLNVLVTWTGGWRQIALEQWSEGKWNPGGPSWQERFVPLLVVSWPAVYLVALLSVQHRADKRKSLIT